MNYPRMLNLKVDCLIYVSYSDILYILMFSVLIIVGLEFLDFFVGFGILTQFSWY